MVGLRGRLHYLLFLILFSLFIIQPHPIENLKKNDFLVNAAFIEEKAPNTNNTLWYREYTAQPKFDVYLISKIEKWEDIR